MFKVYKKGDWPKPKKHFFKEEFSTRQKARNFCRNRSWWDGLIIVYPDKSEEIYTK